MKRGLSRRLNAIADRVEEIKRERTQIVDPIHARHRRLMRLAEIGRTGEDREEAQQIISELRFLRQHHPMTEGIRT